MVNATLKSGSNNLHGSLFEFHKNDHLYARDVFATGKALTVYNQFGGTVGGKIRRDKTFFFMDYQGSRDRLGSFQTTETGTCGPDRRPLDGKCDGPVPYVSQAPQAVRSAGGRR